LFGAPRLAVSGELLVLKLLQCHGSERSSVAHAMLRKLDDLPGDENAAGMPPTSATLS